MADVGAKRQEERVKLFASAVFNLGVAFIVGGFVGPSVAGRLTVSIGAGSVLLGLGLHLAARCILHYVVSEPSSDRDVDEER